MNATQPGFLKCFLLIFILFLADFSFGQEKQEEVNRPVVGLVLSGGGAKGLAHVGVIKVLEEVGITPDIVTGTSMGSIVGGLYSMGYTVEELSEINASSDWVKLLSDAESLEMVAMDEKWESDKYLFDIPIKDRRVGLPSGLIEGQHIENYISSLTWPLTSSQDFNKLPIPFHCMALDLYSGQDIEFESGDLAKAIRSSMSIPTVFSPVALDTLLMVDGGVTCNFPVQEAIDMGAEVIIGVYVGYEEKVGPEDLSSMSDILQRATAIGGIVDASSEYSKCDVLIFPELNGLTSSDFTKTLEIEKMGEETARKQIGELIALAEEHNLSYREIPKIDRPEEILISDIEVEGTQFISEDFVKIKSGFKEGDSLSYDDILESIQFMYGTQHFQKLTFSLKDGLEEGTYILVFHVKERPRAQINLAPNYDNRLAVGLVANLTLRNIVLPSSRFLLTLRIAQNPSVRMLIDKKQGKSQRISSQFFLDSYSYYLPYYLNGRQISNYDRRYFDAGFGVHSALGLDKNLGIDIMYRYNSFFTGFDFTEFFPDARPIPNRCGEWAAQILYNQNTTDDLYFPTKGNRLKFIMDNAYVINSDIDRPDYHLSASINYNMYRSFGERTTYNFGFGAGKSTQWHNLNGAFALGGLHFGNVQNYIDFVGYNIAELYAQNFIYLKSAVDVEVFRGIYLSAIANVGNIEMSQPEFLNGFLENGIHDYTWGYSVGLKYNSVLGPVQVMVADNNQDAKARFYVGLGYPF